MSPAIACATLGPMYTIINGAAPSSLMLTGAVFGMVGIVVVIWIQKSITNKLKKRNEKKKEVEMGKVTLTKESAAVAALRAAGARAHTPDPKALGLL